MQKYELMRGAVLVVIGAILVGFAAGPVIAQVSFDQLLTANATCTVEGQAPIVIPIGTGQVNGCSDGVRGTETIAVIDERPLESLPLLFAVGNFPCSGTQLATFRNIVEETVAAVSGIAADGGQQINVCGGSGEDATITPRDVRGTLAFSFPEPVALEFDLAVSGLVSGTTLLTINGMPVSSSGIVQVTGTDFTVEIFVPKEAPGQVVGDIVVRAASATDADGDGVPDAEDECPASDVRPTVVIDGCDSGVTNLVFDDGCTIADLVTNCAEEAKNHGMFVSCMAHVSNDLKRTGAIGEKQKGALQRCAATASKP